MAYGLFVIELTKSEASIQTVFKTIAHIAFKL